MRRLLFGIIATAAAATVCGCAGGSQSVSSTPQSAFVPPAARTLSQTQISPNKYLGPRELFVADDDSNDVKILQNGSYREVGVLRNGISVPEGLFVDRRGNLYVANNGTTDTVTEYAPNNSSPSFTYSASMQSPLSVSVDRHGNVYEADGAGYVNQYFQGDNSLVAQCSLSANAQIFGVTVDTANDVFISAFLEGIPAIIEYKGGLAGCSATLLGLQIQAGYGITMDKNDDLVIADLAGQVDIVAPPYTSITRVLASGLAEPSFVALTANNQRAYVSEFNGNDVLVFDYATGTLITRLNSVYGLDKPAGVVDSPNAVY